MAIAVVDSELVELVRFQLPGKPSNWSNTSKGKHWAQVYQERRDWKERTILHGLEARAKAKLGQPLGFRQVEVVLHSARFFDLDGAYTAVKPVVDGLKGFLIVDDSPRHCEIVVRQQKVKHYPQQFVEVIVRERRPAA